MIPSPNKAGAKFLLALASLWIIQGCAQVASQYRPVEVGRPTKTETLVSGGSEKVSPEKEPATSATIEKPSPEPESSFAEGPEAPARVAALVPVPGETTAIVEPPPIPPEPAYFLHVVRWKGETLSLIAQWYTASWRNWQVLARANPGVDPDRITIGNRIQIPERLLKKREPFPIEFIPPYPGPPPSKSIHAEPGTDTDEVVLFGPSQATTRQAPAPEEMELFEPGEIAGKPAQTPEEPGLFGPME